MIKNVDMFFEYLPYIDAPPKKAEDMYRQACSNDGVTLQTWRKTWIDQIKANHEKYGPFKDRSIGRFYEKYARQPCIVIGSGPSLSKNIDKLKNTGGIPKVSCLHNFHYMIDNEVDIDFYVSLDAGLVTLEELSEGGKHSKEHYLKSTEGKTLLAFTGSHPNLLESWKGDIYFFCCPLPDKSLLKEIDDIEPFEMLVSSGGNVLGAATYIAKSIMGCNPIAFAGADFSFSYTRKFHAWDSKYDKKLGNCVRTNDIYGHHVLTWGSYYNFKTWFEWLTMTVPGMYINCTEGGILGAYPEGNIRHIKQMSLAELINMYSLHTKLKNQCSGVKDNVIMF